MQDDLLTQLLNASSEEEKAYLLAMALVETQPPDIREAVIAAAVPHWFDAEILAALLTHPVPLPRGEIAPDDDPEDETPVRVSGVETPVYTPSPFQGENPPQSGDGIQTGVSTPGTGAGSLYCAIRNLNLPFVQPFGEIGLTLHDLTRAGIRAHLFKNDPERFKTYSRRAAAYFAGEDDPQRRVEGIYHRLVENNGESRDAFYEQMEIYCKKHGRLNLNAANMLLANLIELTTAGIVGGNAIERLLGVGYRMLGDLQQNRGSISAAEDTYRKSFVIRERLAKANHMDIQAQRDLSISYNNLGDIARQHGDLSAAQQAYQQSLAIDERLMQDDPTNVEVQRDLSVSYNRLGDLARWRGDLSAAQQAYQQSLKIRERLACVNPANPQAQRDISVSYNRLGDLAQRCGDLSTAQQSYQQCHEILKRLAQSDPVNMQSQSDLSVSYNKLGDIAQRRGDLSTAQMMFQQSLAIREQLVHTDSANAEAQRDLSASYSKLGRIEELLYHIKNAYHWQKQALSIAQKLFDKDPKNVNIRNDIATFQGSIQRLLGDEALARGDAQAALAAYQRAFDLSRQVAEEQLNNLDALRDTYWNAYKIGVALAALGQAEQARDAFRNALALAEPFAAQPENALAQRDVETIRAELRGCG